MGNYSNIEKEILILLRDQDIGNIKLLGNAIQKAFFHAEEMALLVDCTNRKAMLFFPIRKPYKHEDRKKFAKLISLLSFIETLEKNGQIYIEPSNAECEMFFYENFKGSFLHGIQKNSITKEAISQQEQIIYDIDEHDTIDMGGIQVPKNKSDNLFISKDGTKIMQSTDVSGLYERIYKLLCSRAFPTSVLSRFISNGYCLDEEKRSINSLHYAQASFIVAMLALIVSLPCISVWYSNKYAYSTIDIIQYNTLMKKLDAIEKNGEATNANSNIQIDSMKYKIYAPNIR